MAKPFIVQAAVDRGWIDRESFNTRGEAYVWMQRERQRQLDDKRGWNRVEGIQTLRVVHVEASNSGGLGPWEKS